MAIPAPVGCHDLRVASGLATEATRTASSLTGRMTSTAMVRVAGLVCTLVTAVTLARLLGAGEFGRNALALSWATGLGASALAGTDQLLLRELSADGSPARRATLRRFVRRQVRPATAIATGLAVVVSVVALGASLLPAVLGIVVLFGAMRRRQAMLLADGRTGVALAGESVGLPLLQLALAVPLLSAGVVRHGAVVTVSAFAVALTIVIAVQSRATGSQAEAAEPAAADRRAWRRSSRSFMLVSTVVIAQASIDLWILGALGNDAQVGRYAVAARLATLVALPLTVTTFALAREAAVLHAAGGIQSMQRDVTTTGRLAAAAAATLAGAVLLTAPLLESVLGKSFHDIATPLLILVAGQLANVAIGPVATLLLMTGHERDVRNTLLVATALNAGLTAALVPVVGAVGAAVGAAVSLAAWNVVLHHRVRRCLGITTGPFVLSRLR
jgi:O-antigen/teichoic acid export membrane protein